MPKILLHDEGYYIFKFKSEEDKENVINFGPYYFSNRPLILKPWVLDFEFDKEILSVVPIWVKFLGLPVGYWSIESLSEITSAAGRPMHTDLVTANVEKISYARILIEVDVSQPLTEVISIETPSGLWEKREENGVNATNEPANIKEPKKRQIKKAQHTKMVWQVVVRKGNNSPDDVRTQQQQCSHENKVQELSKDEQLVIAVNDQEYNLVHRREGKQAMQDNPMGIVENNSAGNSMPFTPP
ncbi:hypothetical protein KY285_000585 [Solanum tuberosum]|nr:hypothetical protein KY285_000585 [Solanum tuberosum]